MLCIWWRRQSKKASSFSFTFSSWGKFHVQRNVGATFNEWSNKLMNEGLLKMDRILTNRKCLIVLMLQRVRELWVRRNIANEFWHRRGTNGTENKQWACLKVRTRSLKDASREMLQKVCRILSQWRQSRFIWLMLKFQNYCTWLCEVNDSQKVRSLRQWRMFSLLQIEWRCTYNVSLFQKLD